MSTVNKQKELASHFIDAVLNTGKKPTSVYKFCKEIGWEEKEFYACFTNFERLESKIFSLFLENSIELLNKNKDFQGYDARNKMLSLYFTFFETLTANRSYVLSALQNEQNPLKKMKVLNELRQNFKTYVKGLEIDTLDFKQEALQKVQEKSIESFFWMQLLLILKFWMDDPSPSFEKTDLFIEKSLQASFDVLSTQPVKSFIDLGKFIIKERMNFKM